MMVSIEMDVNCGYILITFVMEFSVGKKVIIGRRGKNFFSIIMWVNNITPENN
jgi:hypothetical protein